jgi:hypothetical protein
VNLNWWLFRMVFAGFLSPLFCPTCHWPQRSQRLRQQGSRTEGKKNNY